MKIADYKINRIYFIFVFCCAALISVAASDARAQTGVLCPFPGDCEPAYRKFKPWDLPFSTGRQSEFDKGDSAESLEFYAVVLDSKAIGFSEGDLCLDFSEKQRQAAQKLYPKNKVFASRYCGGELPTIIYKGFGDWHERTFMAVFLGVTDPESEVMNISEKDARAFLAKAKKNYPKAELRKMTVTIDYTDEK